MDAKIVNSVVRIDAALHLSESPVSLQCVHRENWEMVAGTANVVVVQHTHNILPA